MKLKSLLSSGASTRALSYSHLSGGTQAGAAVAKRAEDDLDNKPKDAAAEDMPPDDADPMNRGRKSGEKPGDDPGDEDGSQDDDTEAAPAEGADDDEEMRGKGVAAQARSRERARCAAIVAAADASQVPFACELAFATTISRHEAVALLGKAPKAAVQQDIRNGREHRNPAIGSGGASRPTSRPVQAGWDAAIGKANPKKR